MGAVCHTCKRDVSTVREVRGCGQCQTNGTAAGVHCRFEDFDPVEAMIEGWVNPPFTTHAKLEEEKAAQLAEAQKAEKASAAAEAEAKEVEEEIEMAAGILLEVKEISADTPTAASFAQQIHESHTDYPAAILETRIAKRAEEMKMHAEATVARYARDISDRAILVADREQLIGDAAAAILAAYPDKEGNAILEELGAAVSAIVEARGEQVAVPALLGASGGVVV